MIRGDEMESGCRGGEVLAGSNRIHIRHDVGERCVDNCMGKLTRHFAALCHRLEMAEVLLDRAIGIAIEVRGDCGELLIERGKLLLGVLQVSARCVEGRLRRDMRVQEVLLTA
jgi:hypothetical protein